MHQAAFVGVGQAGCRLADVFAGLGDGQGATLLHQAVEIHTLDILHHQKMRVAGLVRVFGPNDVRMIELSQRANFALEAQDVLRPGQVFLVDHLDGDDPFHERVAGLVDLSHAAVAELFEQLVLAKPAEFRLGTERGGRRLPCGQRRRGRRRAGRTADPLNQRDDTTNFRIIGGVRLDRTPQLLKQRVRGIRQRVQRGRAALAAGRMFGHASNASPGKLPTAKADRSAGVGQMSVFMDCHPRSPEASG